MPKVQSSGVRFPRCPDCGGEVKLIAREGRTREFLRGIHLPVPRDFEIPTCSRCGEESMVPEISERLDQLLKHALAAQIRECVETLRTKYQVANQDIEDALGVTRSYLSHLLAGRQTSATLLKLLRSFVYVPGAFQHALGRELPHEDWQVAFIAAGVTWGERTMCYATTELSTRPTEKLLSAHTQSYRPMRPLPPIRDVRRMGFS